MANGPARTVLASQLMIVTEGVVSIIKGLIEVTVVYAFLSPVAHGVQVPSGKVLGCTKV